MRISRRRSASVKLGTVAPEKLLHRALIQRTERQPAAARADRRQQAAGRMANEDDERLGRRLLQDLQERVGGAAVQLVDAVDDDDAPAAGGRLQVHEGAELADVVDDDLGAKAVALLVIAALDGQQVRMAAAGDLAEYRRAFAAPRACWTHRRRDRDPRRQERDGRSGRPASPCRFRAAR